MDSYKSTDLISESERARNPNKTSFVNKRIEIGTLKTPEIPIGLLDVFIHEARDIHNICIYHKQDVYAKISLTNDPETLVSTQIINGGGRNPVFNQSLRLDVQNIDSSLKCEIWMLSRVKNYLEDQLLGFALVPLSDVVVANNKLVQEFSLSSTDLFHSPAGFVRLSISYTGSSPDVLALTPRSKPLLVQENDESALAKIEFPDLNIEKENKMMVSEYFGVPCTNLDSRCDEDLISAESGFFPDNEAGVRVVECIANSGSPEPVWVWINGSPNEKDETSAEKSEGESPVKTIEDVVVQPVINIKMEPQQSVVQQDIVDIYMKSMQQFTESLVNMKLLMDIEDGNAGNRSGSGTENGGSGSENKLEGSAKTRSRVFYGSQAFF